MKVLEAAVANQRWELAAYALVIGLVKAEQLCLRPSTLRDRDKGRAGRNVISREVAPLVSGLVERLRSNSTENPQPKPAAQPFLGNRSPPAEPFKKGDD